MIKIILGDGCPWLVADNTRVILDATLNPPPST